MKRAIALQFLIVFAAQGAFANGLSDSVAAFTGARTVLVWLQDNWCNADYTPKSGCSGGTDLMLLDTREGVQRTLVKGVKASYIRISRSAKWATYNDIANKKTYIIDLTIPNATPKVFLDNATSSYWCARAMWVDQNTGAEYSFCLDNYDATAYNGTAIYKVPFNSSTGTANLSGATKVKCNSTAKVDDAIAVSADGKKLGGAFPWPDTKILDLETGALADRHNGMFGCQANLAPDNSYRFHHCEDDHLGVIMFGPNLATTNWFVNMAPNLVGLPSSTYTMDFAAPRWTNHLQYESVTSPMCDNAACYEGDECSFSAAEVKSLKMYMISQWYLVKWASDFTKLEKSMYITPDPRIKSWGGDAWIASGIVAPGSGTATAAVKSLAHRSLDLRLTHSEGRAIISSPAGARVCLSDAQGRLARQWDGERAINIDTRTLDVGVYVVSAVTANGRATRELVVAR